MERGTTPRGQAAGVKRRRGGGGGTSAGEVSHTGLRQVTHLGFVMPGLHLPRLRAEQEPYEALRQHRATLRTAAATRLQSMARGRRQRQAALRRRVQGGSRLVGPESRTVRSAELGRLKVLLTVWDRRMVSLCCSWVFASHHHSKRIG